MEVDLMLKDWMNEYFSDWSLEVESLRGKLYGDSVSHDFSRCLGIWVFVVVVYLFFFIHFQ